MAEPRRALRLAAALLLATVAGAALHADGSRADVELAKARAALTRSDGVGAEIALRAALNEGVPRDRVAAGMGEALLYQGQPDAAREWLGKGEFAPGEAIHGFRMLARLEVVQGNLPAAGKALDRAIAIDPRRAEIWVDVAQLRYRGGEQIQAIAAVEQALEIAPANPRALMFRGLLLRDSDGPGAAIPWFEAALLKDRSNPELLAEYAATLGDMGQANRMLAVTRQMLAQGANAPRAMFYQAVMAARAGDVSLARALMNKVGDRLGAMPAARLLEAALELEAGNANVAAQELERLFAEQPQNETVRNLLARAYAGAGQPQRLVEQLAPYAARPGASPYLLTLVGRALEDLGRREEAAPFLDRAAMIAAPGLDPVIEPQPLDGVAARYRAAPRSPDAAIAYARALVGAGRAGEAEGVAERLRAEMPGLGAGQAAAGDVQYALGRYPAALERYGVAARVRLDDALLARMVLAASRSGQAAQGAALVTTFLGSQPASRPAARLAADFAASGGDWPRARMLLRHLHDTGGSRDVRLLADMAFASLRLGDLSAAQEAASAAYRLQPASRVAAQAWAMALTARKQDGDLAEALAARAR